jgi:peptidoglycan hydrolase CwlO-like protein
VIEFVLLFALGFLTAALVALIVAPIIQRRVVKLTERRIRASVPLSAAEIRAEKDMARAAFAAENARLSVDLKHNRDLLTESVARGTRLSNELVTIRSEKLDAEKRIEEQDADIRDLHSQINARDARITTLTGNFGDAARLAEARKHEIAMRDDKINRLGAEIEELRIDLVTLDTEAENFKSQIRELRTERNALRESLKDAESTSRDLENRLKSNDERLAQSEEKLARAITALTDRENALERRIAEVDRFKAKNRELSDELRQTKSALKEANSLARKAAVNGRNGAARQTPPNAAPPQAGSTTGDAAESAAAETPASGTDEPAGKAAQPSAEIHRIARDKPAAQPKPAVGQASGKQTAPAKPEVTEDLSEDEKIDRLRARQAALIERLLKANTSGNDAALRREIATVAAMMVELTAGRDGVSSPIYNILKGSEDPAQPGSTEPSLAARAREMLAGNG